MELRNLSSLLGIISSLILISGCDSTQGIPVQQLPVYSPHQSKLGVKFFDQTVSDGMELNSGSSVLFQITGGQFPFTVSNPSEIGSQLVYYSLDMPYPVIAFNSGNNATPETLLDQILIKDATGQVANVNFKVNNFFHIKNALTQAEEGYRIKVGELWGGVKPYSFSIISSGSTRSTVTILNDSKTGRADLILNSGYTGTETVRVTDSANHYQQWNISIVEMPVISINSDQ